MSSATRLPGFSVDLNLDDEPTPAKPSLADLASNLDLPAIKPSADEIRAVEEAGERVGFARREPQPISKPTPKPVAVEKPQKTETMLTLRLHKDVKTRFQDLCHAEGREAKVGDTLDRMMSAFLWAKDNGWEG